MDGSQRGLDTVRLPVKADEHANTSCAAVAVALDVGHRGGGIQQGDLVLLEAMGGGFTWGASLLRM